MATILDFFICYRENLFFFITFQPDIIEKQMTPLFHIILKMNKNIISVIDILF